MSRFKNIIGRLYITALSLLCLLTVVLFCSATSDYLHLSEKEKQFDKFINKYLTRTVEAKRKFESNKSNEGNAVEYYVLDKSKCLLDATYWISESCFNELHPDLQREVKNEGLGPWVTHKAQVYETYIYFFGLVIFTLGFVALRFWAQWLFTGKITLKMPNDKEIEKKIA